MNYSKLTDFNGTPVAEISAGGYTAMIAYELGSNVIRLHDDKNGIEFFRFKNPKMRSSNSFNSTLSTNATAIPSKNGLNNENKVLKKEPACSK